MSQQKRAFAQKLKPRNSDLRRQVVSSTSIKSVDIMASFSRVSLAANLPLYDVIDPVDFEECVCQGKTKSYESTAYCNWSIRQFSDFPSDDVELKIIPREIVYKDSPIKIDNSSKLDTHVKDVLCSYSANFVVVNRKYEQFSTGESYRRRCAESLGILQNLPRQIFEADLDEIYDNSSHRASFASGHSDSTAGSGQGHDSNVAAARESWSSIYPDLQQCMVDPVIPGIVERLSLNQMDTINSTKREKNRQPQLFSIYPVQHEDDVVEKRLLPPLPSEWKGHRLFLKINSLKMDLDIEPIFASAALYDAKEKKKISENLYFDCNSDAIKGLLKSHVPFQDISSLCSSAVFSVTHASADLFLVFRLEKVLQAGDLSELVEPYLKEDRNKEKLKVSTLEFCERLGAYRMPFAWTAVDLSKIISGAVSLAATEAPESSDAIHQSHSGSLLDTCHSDNDSINSAETFDRNSQSSLNGTLKRSEQSFVRNSSFRLSGRPGRMEFFEIDKFKPLTLTVNNFFRQETEKLSDEDLFKYLNDVRKPSSLAKKLKCIPGIIKFDISPYSEEVPNCLSPELLRMVPFHDEDQTVVKEILEFPSKEIYMPNYGYRNLLYVYPKSLNFTSKPGSFRNIAVKIQLMQGSENPLQAIYGKSSCPAKQSYYITTVTYHNKNPQFYDEIKLDLPLDLNDSHHLLFTFYHVSCKPKVGSESQPLETLVGYSWLPLYINKQLPSGEYNLSVLLDQLPSCYFYLPPEVNLPNVKWLDNHKPVFSIEIKAATTVYTQDKHLDTFLSAYHSLRSSDPLPNLNETEMQRIIRNLTKAKPEPLVNFLYIILDKLIDLMLSQSMAHNAIMNLGQTCFEMLGQIAKILTYLVDGFCDQHNRSSLLTTYIHYSKVTQYVDYSSKSGSFESDSNAYRNISAEYNRPNIPSGDNSDLFDIIRGMEKNLMRTGGSGDLTSGFRVPKKLLHEELALQWVVSSGAAREMACGNAWFFFELIIKGMGEYLLIPKPNRIYLKRKLRFSQQFIDDITTLVTTLTSEVISRCGKDMRFVQNLNCSLAFFLRDALSLMDRTYVFGLIRSYCKQMMAKVSTLPESDNLLLLKMECLRIICSHEHYVTLNLPFTSGSLPVAQQPVGFVAQPPSPSPSLSSRSSGGSVTVSSTASANSLGAAELTTEFRSHHFLVGLVLSDLANALELRNRLLQNKSINILRNLFSVHDFDSRLADKFVKAKVAALYFPLLGLVMDANGQLFDPYAHRIKATTSNMFGTGRLLVGYDDHGYEGMPGLNEDLNAADRVPGAAGLQRRVTLSFDDTRNLLICFCWVIKNSDRTVLKHWLNDLSQLRLTQLLDVLQLCVSCFEYKGRGVKTEKASRISLKDLKSAILGFNSARMDILNRHKANKDSDSNADSASGSTGVRWRKEHYNRQSVDSSVFHNLAPNEKIIRYENENDPVSEGNLSTEINTIVLDTLEMIVKSGSSSSSGGDNNSAATANGVTNLVIRVLLHMLACNQSVTTCQHLFASQRAIVAKCPDLLFEEETEQCSDLCLQLLHHCAGRLQPIRAQAAASLYLLLRQGFESGSNFARVKMQITVSLSSLVGTAAEGEWFNEENLRWSLKTVLAYAEADLTHPELADTTFCDQVKDLVFNLHMILSDTVKMKEFQNDFEMLVDLMYRIAKGYQNSPDLRLTWLQSLAQKHYEKGNFSEAGHCYVHAAALASEYMHMMEDLEHLPRGAVTFLNISDNVLEESAVSDDVVSPDEEGICVSLHFTEPGLSMLLEHAAAMFRQAQMYEAAHWVYKILLPIYEHKKNYQKISSIYAILAESLAKIDNKVTIADKRLFGTYFRVGFYGNRFGDLDGQEFVYREPSITKLPEISHRLESFYSEKFGSDSVAVIKDSNNVDRKSLDPNKVYLQITYVEPYFDLWELRRRTTHFEQNYNVNRFVYSTPFTLDGRAHGDLKDQYKRKTILTTVNTFPYVKTRVQVVNKEQRVFTPIEVAIEDIRKKTKELATATNQEPRDPKMLQMVLQGCIGTTVNQGPLEIANVFLADVAEGRKPMDRLQNKLRLSFKDFSKKCHDALRENKRLIGPDQKEYQKELERNYVRFTERLAPMISVFLTGSLKTHHHNQHRLHDQCAGGDNNMAPIATESLGLDDDSAPVSAV